MITPRFYVPSVPRSGTFDLPEAEARHAATVMRLRKGEVLGVFDGAGNEGVAEVVTVERKLVRCVLLEPMQRVNRERQPPVHLGVALPKGDRERILIEKAVELGAASLTPVITHRSVVQPHDGTLERLRRGVIESSKQCGRNLLMGIEPVTTFERFLKADRAGQRWIAHPTCASPTHDARQQEQTVLVGPEGGFSDDEVQLAIGQGWTAIDLGPRILRVETAVAVLLSLP